MARNYVLAIEHNWHLRKMIKANLEALGLEVREAVSEQHGLQLLEADRPDLILLDLDLPGALNLLPAVRRRFAARAVPIVLLSADPPSRQVLGQPEVKGHLLKPFGASHLLEKVQTLLGSG